MRKPRRLIQRAWRLASLLSAGALALLFAQSQFRNDPRDLSLNIAPDGRQAILSTGDGRLLLVDLATGATSEFRPRLPGYSDPTGDDSHRLSLSYPAFSPDGRQIAFTAVSDLWIAPLDGGAAAIRLTGQDMATELMPAFSPDGLWITFVRRYDCPCNPYGILWGKIVSGSAAAMAARCTG